jgi:hypothetical protein
MKDNIETKKAFAVRMYGLAEDFGGEMSKDGLVVRFEALKQYDLDDISKATTWLLKNRENTFPAVPTTREIIRAIEKVSGKIDTKITANLECDKVLRNLSRLGRECVAQFHDPITQHLLTRRWSFIKLDQESVKDPTFKWFRKEFVEAYLDYKKEDVALLECSPGTIPIENLKQLLPGGNK